MPLTIDNDAHAGLVQPVSCVVAHGRPAVQGVDHRVKGGESARPPAYWSCPATNTAGGAPRRLRRGALHDLSRVGRSVLATATGAAVATAVPRGTARPRKEQPSTTV